MWLYQILISLMQCYEVHDLLDEYALNCNSKLYVVTFDHFWVPFLLKACLVEHH